MTPTAYVLSIPLGLVVVASLFVHREDQRFQTSNSLAEIQDKSRTALNDSTVKTESRLASSANFNDARYGFDESAGGGVMLGRNPAQRPLGSRASLPPDWLASQKAKQRSENTLPDITGFSESPPPSDPLAEPIASESGYQITADEVSRLDVGSGKVIFNKNVRMSSPQFHLTCDQLVVHLGDDKNTMQFSEAHGSVNILLTGVPPEKAYRGQSNDAVFDPRKSQIILTGWPKAKGASQEQVAAEATTRMILFTKTGRLVTEGRAQTRVTRAFMEETTGKKSKR